MSADNVYMGIANSKQTSKLTTNVNSAVMGLADTVTLLVSWL